MATNLDIDAWLASRQQRDDALYNTYGKPLETAQHGKFVAISVSGAVIVGDDAVTVAQDAVRRFGAGEFAFRRVGYPFVARWLTASTPTA